MNKCQTTSSTSCSVVTWMSTTNCMAQRLSKAPWCWTVIRWPTIWRFHETKNWRDNEGTMKVTQVRQETLTDVTMETWCADESCRGTGSDGRSTTVGERERQQASTRTMQQHSVSQVVGADQEGCAGYAVRGLRAHFLLKTPTANFSKKSWT